jgi:acyl-CoA thioesterase
VEDQRAPQPTCFDRDTALRPLGEGRFGVTISRDWWVVAGPNGGLVAALVVKAAEAAGLANAAERGEPAQRTTRSVTVHYLLPPGEGPAELLTSVERTGRAVSFVSVRLVQAGEVRALGLVALGIARPPGRGVELAFQHAPVPSLPPPEHCPRLVAVDPPDAAAPSPSPSPSSIRDRWDSRWAIGWLPDGEAPPPRGIIEHGGWVRLAEPQPYEPAVLAAMADAWIPPLLTRPELGRFSVPTVELTVHVLDRAALDDLAPDDWCLVRFATDTAADGFLTEEGSIWSPDGSLLAHARQLALITPFPEGRMPPLLTLDGAGQSTDERRVGP